MWRRLLVIRAEWLAIRSEHERLVGRYDSAERLIREAIALSERVSAPNAMVDIRLRNSLGVICKYQGCYREGARAYLRALRSARKRLGPDHPSVATIYHNLGGLEHSRARYTRGELFARRAVLLRERALGPDPDVARDVAALAGILDGLKRHDEAEVLHRRALDIFERRFGAKHREAGFTLANLAACLHLQGRAGEAEPLAGRALDIQERRLGPHHPDVAVTRSNLASIRSSSAGSSPSTTMRR